MADLEGLPGLLPSFFAICALALLVIGIGAVLKRKWARRELAALRKKYQETDVSDPEYNAVRALYISASADHDRRSGADRLTGSGDAADHSTGNDGGGDGGGGD